MNKIFPVLFDMNSRIFGPYLAAMHGILIAVMHAKLMHDALGGPLEQRRQACWAAHHLGAVAGEDWVAQQAVRPTHPQGGGGVNLSACHREVHMDCAGRGWLPGPPPL
jgi:hypothetical protein